MLVKTASLMEILGVVLKEELIVPLFFLRYFLNY